MAIPRFHELEVINVRRLTGDAIAISFSVPEHLEASYLFVPGQYLTLRAQIDSQDVRRSYSICSAVGEPLEIGVKQVESGRFSSFATTLRTGDKLQVMTPLGNFKARDEANNYLLIAAGSGITPCLSILKSTLSAQTSGSCLLLYGNRDAASVMFNNDLNALKDSYTSRFMLTHIMSRERQGARLLHGRIDGETILQLILQGLIHLDRYNDIYLCGPHQMIDQCRGVFSEVGIAASKIHFELFTTDSKTAVAAVAKRKEHEEAVSSESVGVKIIIDGAERSVAVDAKNETVLIAARRAGLDLPFSCAGGMCCTCRCKVLSGDTAMDMNYSLADWEVDAGFTLACQTRPLNADVVLDFDAS